MRFFKLITFTVLFIFTLHTNSQSPKQIIESLKKELKTNKDKARKVAIYLEIATHTRRDSIDKLLTKAYHLAKELNNKKLLAKATILKAKPMMTTSTVKDSFLFQVHKGLTMTNDPEILSYGYELLSHTYTYTWPLNIHKDSSIYYSQKLLQSSKEKRHLAIANRNLAYYYYREDNDPIRAKKHYLKGLELSYAIKDSTQIAFSYADFAEFYTNMHYYNLAISNYEEELKFVTKNSLREAAIYLYIADLIDKVNPKNPERIKMIEKSTKMFQNLNGNKFSLAYPLIELSEAYLDFNKNEEALIVIEKMKKLGYASKDPNFFKPLYFSRKASYYNNIGKKDSAIVYFNRSNKVCHYKDLLAENYQDLGLIYKDQNTKLAKENFLKALKIGKENNVQFVIPIVYKYLKEVYELEKKYKTALTYGNLYTKVKDSLDRLSKKNAIEEFVIKSENLEKEKKISDLEKENREKDIKLNKELQFYGIIVTVTLLILLLIYFNFWYKKKKESFKANAEIEKVKEIIKTKNTILENLSHEIRTPVTVINGYLHLIKQQNTMPLEVIRFANMAEKNSNSILSNFNNFLTLLSNNEKKVLLEKIEQKQLTVFFNDILHSFKGNANMKNIGVFYKCNFKDTLTISYDFNKLDKIISNLITNAIKYTNAKKNIYIDVFMDAETLKIDVKDEGIGIATEEQGLVFNRFYQSKKHKTPDGFGIGLSLVKELTNSLNGTIRLKSEENIGSIFSLILPVEKVNIELHTVSLTPKYKNITSFIEVDTIIENNFPKVLMVDDNLEMITYLKEILQPHYNCIFANNGRDALEKIKNNNIDLIISDFRMPVMDGLTLKEELNNLDDKNIPFLLITAYDFEDYAKVKIRLGIQDYIAKPFTHHEIITRTRKLLENSIYIKNIKEIDTPIQFEGHIADLLEKIKGLVLKNISDTEYTTSDLAKDCSYGQQQLGRIIKSNTGLTLIQLILEIRLQKAYELIINKKYASLMEIIYAIGLTNRSYFNRKFTERFGVTPKELFKT
jgi:signal transduction histidine kinase/AraC-like DNA-binding protein